nr:uncharacterized protein yae1 [Quercus suber]
MLREVLPFREDFKRDTFFMNTADLAIRQQNVDHPANTNTLDDVFGSAPASPVLTASDDTTALGRNISARHGGASDEISDIHRLRSTHVTNGYREGIAVSKEKFIQEGFDEGYNLGAELGLKVGWCLGTLEGIWYALKPNRLASLQSSSQQVEPDTTRAEVAGMYSQAEEELTMQRLYASDYFGTDGIWLYDVQDHEDDSREVTFDEIAAAHPLVQEWLAKVEALAQKLGLKLE